MSNKPTHASTYTYTSTSNLSKHTIAQMARHVILREVSISQLISQARQIDRQTRQTKQSRLTDTCHSDLFIVSIYPSIYINTQGEIVLLEALLDLGMLSVNHLLSTTSNSSGSNGSTSNGGGQTLLIYAVRKHRPDVVQVGILVELIDQQIEQIEKSSKVDRNRECRQNTKQQSV